MRNDTPQVAAPLGTIKDFLSELRSEINLIEDYDEFKESKPYMLDWILNIEVMLGLKEVQE